MGEGNIFGSDELTPELVRGATFTDHDGRYDAAEVREYLDRVATAVGVFLSGDAPTALRAEFARNAEIAQQVLDAGQAAAEQLRRQAVEEARVTFERAQAEAQAMRDDVIAEIASSRTQVSDLRGQFIQDLRDLYDRIGASLYRFERALAEEEGGPVDVPTSRTPADPAPTADAYGAPASPAPTPAAPTATVSFEPVTPSVADTPILTDTFAGPDAPPLMPSVPTRPDDADASAAASPDAGAETDARPPAYTQLPADAWTAEPPLVTPVAAMELGDPFEAIVEDEPLAPGEPLVDLRGFLDTEPPAQHETRTAEELAAAPGPEVEFTNEPASHGESVFSDHVELPVQPEPVTPPGAEQPFASPAEPATAGGWLDGPTDPVNEDARAEALLAGTAGMDHPDGPPAAATAGQVSPGAASASPDALAVRQLILDSVAAGQPRASIEQYLTEQLGLLSPGALIDAALSGG